MGYSQNNFLMILPTLHYMHNIVKLIRALVGRAPNRSPFYSLPIMLYFTVIMRYRQIFQFNILFKSFAIVFMFHENRSASLRQKDVEQLEHTIFENFKAFSNVHENIIQHNNCWHLGGTRKVSMKSSS